MTTKVPSLLKKVFCIIKYLLEYRTIKKAIKFLPCKPSPLTMECFIISPLSMGLFFYYNSCSHIAHLILFPATSPVEYSIVELFLCYQTPSNSRVVPAHPSFLFPEVPSLWCYICKCTNLQVPEKTLGLLLLMNLSSTLFREGKRTVGRQ